MDATRQDHLSCYGYSRSTSPTLEALAALTKEQLNGLGYS